MLHTRLLLVSGILLGLFFAGAVVRIGDAFVLAIPFLLYLALAWLTGPEKIEISAQRKLSSDRIPLDGEVDVVLTLINHGSPLKNVLMADILPTGIEVISGESERLCSLDKGEELILEYAIRGKRGAYRFSGVRAQASDTFDIYRNHETLPVLSRLMILPRVEKLRRMELRPRQTRIYSGQIPARLGGPGVEFHGIRPYQAGDPMRWINTRLSARHPESLFINEFEQERVADIGLILDARLLSNMPSDELSLFEYSIEAVAALSDYLLDGGNRVGMLIYGGLINWTFPGYGRVQKERILQALAHAELGSNPIFEDLSFIPTRLFPLRTQLILFTPVLEEDLPVLLSLRARGYPIIIVTPDSISLEGDLLPRTPDIEIAIELAQLERDLILSQLRQAGIQIVDWDVHEPFTKMAHQILSRPFLQSQPRGAIG